MYTVSRWLWLRTVTSVGPQSSRCSALSYSRFTAAPASAKASGGGGQAKAEKKLLPVPAAALPMRRRACEPAASKRSARVVKTSCWLCGRGSAGSVVVAVERGKAPAGSLRTDDAAQIDQAAEARRCSVRGCGLTVSAGRSCLCRPSFQPLPTASVAPPAQDPAPCRVRTPGGAA